MGRLINYIIDAEKDIDDIFEYISRNFYSENIAMSTVQKIVNGIKKLANIPDMGISLNKKLERKINPEIEIRMLILDQYLVFYFEDNCEIFIMRVLNARQNYMKFLNDFSVLVNRKKENK